MKKYAVCVILTFLFSLSFQIQSVHADSVKIQPLKVQSTLKKGEKKKGFVDITNPTGKVLTVSLYVNSFKQIDNDGKLAFFDNEQLKAGIKLDFDSAVIGPYQTLRLFYIADGSKLPQGDVFGAIFAESKTDDHPGTKTTVRVGTLVIIENGTRGARHTEITALTMAPFQTGSYIDGTASVKNPAPVNSSTGFFPAMKVEVFPWGGKGTFTGPLVFAGNTRNVHFELPSNQFGIYVVKVTANDASKTKIVFIATGWWRLGAPLIIVFVIGAIWIEIRYRLHRKLLRRLRRRKNDPKQKP